MRKASAALVVSAALAFFVSCVDRDPTSPEEQVGSPNFSSHLSECWPDDVVGEIEALFPDTGIRVAALALFDTILRDVERGALREAETKAQAFERFVGNKESKLNDPCGDGPDDLPTQDQAEVVLVGNVYAVAGGNPPLVIPPEAYEPTGGVGLIDPVTGGVVTSNNMEAAVVADEDAFDGTGLVMIVLVRLPDPVVGQPPASGPIPGYQAYPEGYDITSSRQLASGGSGAIVELCVLDIVPTAIDPRLVIGHDLGGGNAELLYPRLATNEVVCGGAGGYDPGGEPVALEGAASPWLKLARRVIAPAKRLFGPKPLNAMYFGGRGLGGRTTSFSNFAPVDPWSLSVSPESATLDLVVNTTVQLNATLTVPPEEETLGSPPDPFPNQNSDFTWRSSAPSIAGVDADGLVEAKSSGIATIEASYEGLTATAEVSVEAVGDAEIAFRSLRVPGREDNNPRGQIFVMEADGSNQRNLSADPTGYLSDHQPAWSPDGSRIVLHRYDWVRADETLVVIPANGFGYSDIPWTRDDRDPAWSPDGTRLAVESSDEGPYDIVLMDLDGSNRVNLTGPQGGSETEIFNRDPDWSPDGTSILYAAAQTWPVYEMSDIWVMDADGSDKVNLTNTPSSHESNPKWSPDGTQILFNTDRDGDSEIYVMDADGSGATNLTQAPGSGEWDAVWSPNGNRIAFVSSRDGNAEIYSMNKNGSLQTRLTDDPADDREPSWKPAGSPPMPVYHTLTVVITGGEGEVSIIGGGGLVCTAPPDPGDQCSQDFEDWVTVQLRAHGAGYCDFEGFGGWAGDCREDYDYIDDCLVDMDTDQIIYAEFECHEP